ncbi:MAG: glycoside hydrolase family 5 protein [Clostridiales bacterium]|nr:glycoside hydrolase family 5 protein [Clostridiales bacterium]
MDKTKIIPAPFEKGVNFTNWLEYRSADEINPDYFTRQDFVNARKLGCDVIRLPIHFEKICREEDGYLIPEKITTILDNVAAWCEELEMYIVLDFHNDCTADSFTPVDVDKILIPVWTQLANRYKDRSEYIVYEIMNEPHNIDIPLWNEIIARVHKVIRQIDQKHWVIVGGADWNSTAAMKTLPDFQDDRVIYNFHYYDPHTFTHQGASWCHMERVIGLPFPYDADKMPPMPENPTEVERRCFENYPEGGQLSAVIDCFDQYAEFSHKRNSPLFCGEFGCFMTVPNDMRIQWYRIVTRLLAERGIARTSWDYFGTFGIFHRVERGVRPRFPEDLNRELLAAMDLNADVE